MNVVITMAGLGTRFKKVGYQIPKYEIEVNGHTLFFWSMLSLKDFNNYNPNYIFIVRKEDNSSKFIKNELSKMGVNKFNIIEIDEITDGQATTALLADKSWNSNEELIIYNIDTYVEEDNIKYENFKGDGFIPCFSAPGNHFSFVKLDDTGKVIEVKEKVRISDNCTIGLYYFKSCNLYKEIYEKFYKSNSVSNEKYIAPMYNYMIDSNMEIYISNIDSKCVHVLGTPDEVEAFKKTYKKTL